MPRIPALLVNGVRLGAYNSSYELFSLRPSISCVDDLAIRLQIYFSTWQIHNLNTLRKIAFWFNLWSRSLKLGIHVVLIERDVNFELDYLQRNPTALVLICSGDASIRANNTRNVLVTS